MWIVVPLSHVAAEHAGAWVIEGRALLAFLVCATVAFPLGAGMPAGLAALPDEAAPWAWGVNGAAAVFGSALAVALAMDLGVGATLALAGVAYLAAVLVLPSLAATEVTPYQVRRRANRARIRYIS